MRHALIEELKETVPVRQLCAILEVSRSGSSAAQDAPPAEADTALRHQIEQIVLAFPGYGDRRSTAALHRAGWVVNHKKVLRLMREECLLCQLQRHSRAHH